MDYEKKYREAQKWIESIYSELSHEQQMEAEAFFPELKESEDERMRKDIIHILKGELNYTSKEDISKYIAWLEKQGEQKVPVNDFKAKDWYVSKVDGKIHNLYYNPTDKVEPKFHEGDWVVFNNNHQSVYQIERIDNYRYYLRHYLGGSLSVHFDNELIRAWTIQDARAGDVLEFGDHGRLVSGIVSYVNKTTGKVDVNCLLENNNFKVGNYYNLDTIKPHPAAKEQRDILFQKMKEAGYEWDDEKKELKKIEQKQEENKRNLGGISSNWSEEDENEVAILEAYIRSKDWSESHIGRALGIVNELVNKCKSSKDRVQPKQEWSEEDETGLTNTIIMLKEGASLHFSKKDITKAVDWLKSLKQRIGG